MQGRQLTREEFDDAVEAIWSEIRYQNSLTDRRTQDPHTGEAKDVPGFLTLIRCYTRKAEDDWANIPAPVYEAMSGLRKIAAIALRGMVYTEVLYRST